MTAPSAVRSGPVERAAEAYFDALCRADEAAAVDVALGLLDSGTSGEDVLLELVAPTQVRVGMLWQTGAWSVAHEHAATCIAERVVFAVGTRTRRRGSRGHVVLGCLDGEWHTLAARIVGEILRMHGWTVTFLGASMPTPHLVSFLHHHGPDAVALSAAVPTRLPAAHRTILAARGTGTPVLVGGPGFGTDGRWARRIGADAWAPTATAAVTLLAQRSSWPVPVAPADLPDAGSAAEFAGVRQRRGRLVVTAIERHRADAGTSGVLTPLSDSPLDDDLGNVVDFLATAAYLGDRHLFTDHVRWLAEVAGHRGVPRTVLPAVIEAFRSELHDFPFAQACLADALVTAGEPA